MTAYDSADLSVVIPIPAISIMVLTSMISILVICGMKLKNRISGDVGIKVSDPHTQVGKKQDRNEDIPVVHNKAYAMHNVSRCIQVHTHPNEAYSVCGGTIINDEPVYEQVQ